MNKCGTAGAPEKAAVPRKCGLALASPAGVVKRVLAYNPFSRYIFLMTITQTIEIPADRRVHLDFEVPREVPAGRTSIILQFPDKKEAQASDDLYAGISSKLDDDLLQSQLDVLEKVDW